MIKLRQKLNQIISPYQAQLWDNGKFEIHNVKEDDKFILMNKLKRSSLPIIDIRSYQTGKYDFSNMMNNMMGRPSQYSTIYGNIDINQNSLGESMSEKQLTEKQVTEMSDFIDKHLSEDFDLILAEDIRTYSDEEGTELFVIVDEGASAVKKKILNYIADLINTWCLKNNYTNTHIILILGGNYTNKTIKYEWDIVDDIESNGNQVTDEDNDSTISQFYVYELDEDGDELDIVGSFTTDKEAIEFSSKYSNENSIPTHVVFVPEMSYDSDYEDFGYKPYEIIHTELNESMNLKENLTKSEIQEIVNDIVDRMDNNLKDADDETTDIEFEISTTSEKEISKIFSLLDDMCSDKYIDYEIEDEETYPDSEGKYYYAILNRKYPDDYYFDYEADETSWVTQPGQRTGKYKISDKELEEAMTNREKLMRRFPELNLNEAADESLLEDQEIDSGDRKTKTISQLPLSYRDQLLNNGYRKWGGATRYRKKLNDYYTILIEEEGYHRTSVVVQVIANRKLDVNTRNNDDTELIQSTIEHPKKRFNQVTELFNYLSEIENIYSNKIPDNLHQINDYRATKAFTQLANFCSKTNRNADLIRKFLRKNIPASVNFMDYIYLEKIISGNDAIINLGAFPKTSTSILKRITIKDQNRLEINYALTNIYIFALKALDEIKNTNIED